MTRRILFVGLGIVLGAGLVCTTPVVAKRRLTCWLPYSYVWKQLETKFERDHPNVDVVFVNGTMDKFYTMITAGLMPDIWGPWGTPGITADVNRNWALDLGPYIKRDGKAMDITDFFPGLMRQFRVRGRQYSLPVFSYTDCFHYNTEMWAQAGLPPPPLDASDKSWTWDRMVANAEKTTKRTADGRVTIAGTEFARGFSDTPNWVHLWGVELYSDEAMRTSIPQDVDLRSPAMVRALTKTWELIYKQKVTSAAGMGFIGGKTASSTEYGYTVIDNMQVKRLKWAIAPLPWAVTNFGALWPDGFRISRIARDKELAWEFVKFLCSRESMKALSTDPKSDRRGSAVARKSIFAETLGAEIGAATGMRPQDVFRVHEQADAVGIVKESETICLHSDLSLQYIEPILAELWANKLSPQTASQKLDERARKGMATLFARWMRNIKYTGVQL